MLYISLNDLSRAPQTTKQLRFLRQEVKTIIIIINVHYLYSVHVCHVNMATNWDIDTCSNTLHASMFYGDKADNLSCFCHLSRFSTRGQRQLIAQSLFQFLMIYMILVHPIGLVSHDRHEASFLKREGGRLTQNFC